MLELKLFVVFSFFQILLFSLTLIIIPSFRPFSLHAKASDDSYTPTGGMASNHLGAQSHDTLPLSDWYISNLTFL